MATAKLKTYKYYDCYEIINRFGMKDINDFIDQDSICGNGCLFTLCNPNEIDPEQLQKATKDELKIHNNQKRIYNELGECDIHIWW